MRCSKLCNAPKQASNEDNSTVLGLGFKGAYPAHRAGSAFADYLFFGIKKSKYNCRKVTRNTANTTAPGFADTFDFSCFGLTETRS